MKNLKEIDSMHDLLARFPRARGCVRAHLPGYSRDGLTAIMRFGFGPTQHGAMGYYLLKKVGGRWEIIGRSIEYWPYELSEKSE